MAGYNSWMKSTNGLQGEKIGRKGEKVSYSEQGDKKISKGFCSTRGCGKKKGHRGKCGK